MAEDRSLSNVLQDIVGNVREMVRSEVRLAKAELREDVGQAMSSGVLIAAGAVGAGFAALFMLWTLVYVLTTLIPMWAATLIVSVVVGAVAAALMRSGVRKARRIQLRPERTVESVKENLEWMKQSTR